MPGSNDRIVHTDNLFMPAGNDVGVYGEINAAAYGGGVNGNQGYQTAAPQWEWDRFSMSKSDSGSVTNPNLNGGHAGSSASAFGTASGRKAGLELPRSGSQMPTRVPTALAPRSVRRQLHGENENAACNVNGEDIWNITVPHLNQYSDDYMWNITITGQIIVGWNKSFQSTDGTGSPAQSHGKIVLTLTGENGPIAGSTAKLVSLLAGVTTNPNDNNGVLTLAGSITFRWPRC